MGRPARKFTDKEKKIADQYCRQYHDLVYWCLKKIKLSEDDKFYHDIVSYSFWVLARCAIKFDESNAKFTTYATKSITLAAKGELERLRFLKKNTRYRLLSDLEYVNSDGDVYAPIIATWFDREIGEEHWIHEAIAFLEGQTASRGALLVSILKWRYWEDLTLEAIGDKVGLNRERIRQLEAKAINRIVKWAKHNGKLNESEVNTEERVGSYV